jgi:hypothetical protein
MRRQGHSRYHRNYLTELSESAGERWPRIRVDNTHSSDSRIIGRVTDHYNVREAHDEARLKGDPCLSPHGMFRSLAAGNRKHSVEFLETFGPLAEGRGKHIVGVALDDFWAEHRRFLLVTRVYENRNDPKRRRKALDEYLAETNRPLTDDDFRKVAENLVNFKATLGTQWAKYPAARNITELEEAQELEQAKYPQPGKEEPKPSEELPQYDAELLRYRLDEGDDARLLALLVVNAEIQYHTSGIRFLWKIGHGRRSDSFYRRLQYDSLLAAIWDLFAADTTAIPWRICPRDQNIFYPPRTDRFYCTSAEQVAASKADYDRRRKRNRG